jgi:predicted SnoaL-like aldol condensation-catalyzing enzyme
MAEGYKESAVSFLKLAAAGKVEEAYERFIDPGFRHHNPYFEGSAESLKAGMAADALQNPGKSLEVKRVLAEGDYVVVYTHIRQKPDELGYAVVHIFRFENDRIAEMWDIGQEIPQESLNQYDMF